MSNRRTGLGDGSAGFAQGLSLAFEFVGAVFLFWLGGRLLDDWLGTEPWIQVVGALIGWVGGFLHVYYRTKGEGWQDTPRTALGTPPTTGTMTEPDAGPSERPGTALRDPDSAGGTDVFEPAPNAADDGNGLGGRR